MIDTIVLHCSDSPNDRDSVDAEEIHRWHKEKDWEGIGYHYVIKRNGLLEMGRPPYWEGAHVSGHNSGSLGICLVGRNEFTDNQMRTLRDLLYQLKFRYQDASICGHYDLDPDKTCPNFNVSQWLETAMPGIDHTVRH